MSIDSMVDSFKEAMYRPINTAAISIMGVFTLLWAFWVGNPFWSTFNSADIFNMMQWVAPEQVWGGVALIVGIIMIHGVVKKSYRSLIIGAQAGFYFWLFAAIGFLFGDWHNTGGITLVMIAVYCGYIALNLRINREYVKSQDPNLVLRNER